LAKAGITGIGITGGEPLLRKDFAKILKYINKKNIKVCLATNLDFYSKHQKIINKYVSTIGVPIEGSTKEIHDSVRGSGNFNNVISAINNIYKNTELQMNFSTVLAGNNTEDLVNIENLLVRYGDRISYWKIYDIINYSDRQFQSIRSNKLSKVKLKEIINGLGDRLGKDKVFYLSPDNRSEASLLINPNGEAVIPINKKAKTKDFILGNFLEDSASDIFKKWNKVTDYNKYACHKCALKCLNN
jgi:MoaA/NifB/PqqE/SkfB family radical SAM enzyme